jgi:rhodanese-related sulfurtransferase
MYDEVTMSESGQFDVSPARSKRWMRLLGVLGLLLGGASAMAQGVVMSAPEVNALLTQGKTILVDVRTPEEWRETGLPAGALRLDYANRGSSAEFVTAFAALVGGDRSAPVAVICRSGNRSAKVQSLLRDNGFTSVINVAEGMRGGEAGPGWLKRGLPVIACPTC